MEFALSSIEVKYSPTLIEVLERCREDRRPKKKANFNPLHSWKSQLLSSPAVRYRWTLHVKMQWRTDATSSAERNGEIVQACKICIFQESLKITKKIKVVNNFKDKGFNSKNQCKVKFQICIFSSWYTNQNNSDMIYSNKLHLFQRLHFT